jgi:hypothetical protein
VHHRNDRTNQISTEKYNVGTFNGYRPGNQRQNIPGGTLRGSLGKKSYGVNSTSMQPTHHESAPLLNARGSRNLGSIPQPEKLVPSHLFSSVSVRTRPGFNGYTLKTNQDSFVVDKCFNDNGYHAFIACFDGHGQFGHKVSQFLKRTIVCNFFCLGLKKY